MKVRSILAGGLAATATAAGLVLTVAGSPVSAGGRLAPALAVDPTQATDGIARLTNGAPPAQAEALRDRRVTRDEYRAAVASAADCVVESVRGAAAAEGIDAEVVASAPQLSGDGFEYTYTFAVDVPPGTPVPADAQTRLSALQARCQATHMDRVAAAHQLQSLSTASFTRRVADRFAGCLGAAGVDVPAARSADGARAALTSVLGEIAADPTSAAADCVVASPAVTADPIGTVDAVLAGAPAG